MNITYKKAFKKPISLVVIIAMYLVSITLPYFSFYSVILAARAKQSPPNTLFPQDEKILICTSSGFKWVKLKDLLETNQIQSEKKEKPNEQTDHKCALCYFSSNPIADQFVNKEYIFHYNNLHLTIYHLASTHIIYGHTIHKTQPRAPPHLT